MTLSTYRKLIQNLPYLDQAFETKQSTWRYECSHHPAFASFCGKQFINGRLKLSRRDLFVRVEKEVNEALFSIILWGYPRNMRGRSFTTILMALAQIENIIKSEKKLTVAAFASLCQQLKGTGVGLSTLTKFLYFFGFSVEGFPCLILDQRIVQVLQKGLYQELSGLQKISLFNKQAEYLHYLQQIHQIAEKEGYQADQLELFLFHFGRNLK